MYMYKIVNKREKKMNLSPENNHIVDWTTQ